jgi:hypothetical protein
VLFARKGATKLTATDGEIRDVRTSVGAVRRRLSGKVSMPYFAGLLSNMLDRPVSDMTELGGLYDVDLEWSADEAIGANFDDPPSLFTVLQENLGLRLERRKTPVELYVIDHVERLPTENWWEVRMNLYRKTFAAGASIVLAAASSFLQARGDLRFDVATLKLSPPPQGDSFAINLGDFRKWPPGHDQCHAERFD